LSSYIISNDTALDSNGDKKVFTFKLSSLRKVEFCSFQMAAGSSFNAGYLSSAH